jgi:thiamine kinase-like enzyme
MTRIHDFVGENGELESSNVLQREVLYIGNSGRAVERFITDGLQSYIFKPLTNETQLGHETWVYENLLPSLPEIYPKLLAYSRSSEPGRYWMIFEDLGHLSHEFEPQAAVEISQYIEQWHAMPTNKFQGLSMKAHKPFIEDIIKEIGSGYTRFLLLLSQLEVPESLFKTLLAKLADQNSLFSEKVVSHGDLHLGNYTRINGKLMTLDWEHAHLNTRMWDLYHALDMSHPLFPKSMTSSIRQNGLNAYLDRLAMRKGAEPDRETFLQQYYLFSATFSLWMLDLIRKDLDRPEGKWPAAKLEKQLVETLQAFVECAQEL